MKFRIPKDKIWPTIIIGVLVLDVAIGIMMMRLAADDPHAAIEPDYYRKGVEWDSTLAQKERNTALGWSVATTLGPVAAGEPAQLTIQLHDAAGVSIPDAVVSVEAMQVAHANETLQATLKAESGGYGAQLPMTRPGLWEFRVQALRGDQRFTTNIRLDASATGMAQAVLSRPGDAPTLAPTRPPGE